jgi:hypothetical protein
MPRAITAALCVVSASLGFVAGYAAPRDPIAAASARDPIGAITARDPGSPRQARDAPALPSPAPSVVAEPAVAPTMNPKPVAPPLPRVAPLSAVPPAPLSADRPRAVAESVATPRAPSPLSAFRFAGVGPSGGLRLARVRPNTLPAALGLQSGDELVSINQFRLSDPEQALLAYARLRYAERLELAIRRNGQPTAIVYSVR